MFECFFPDAYMDSTYVIDFEKLYKEGIRGVIFDIDNTLVPHGAPADERAIRLFARLRSIGLDYCLISNNQLPRVKPFADAVQAKFVEDAHKPSRKNYLKAMKLMHVDLDSCIFVGDQIFTDILGANLAGMASILVEPFQMEPFFRFRFKRFLERGILKRYRAKQRRQNF